MLFSKQSMQSFAKQRSATFFINRRVKTDHKTRAFWVFQKPAHKEAPMQTNFSNKGTERAFPRETTMVGYAQSCHDGSCSLGATEPCTDAHSFACRGPHAGCVVDVQPLTLAKQ